MSDDEWPAVWLKLSAAASVLLAVDLAGNLAFGQVPSSVGTKAGQVREDNGLKMKLVWCPPGKFAMGSPEEEKHPRDETQVRVTLTKGFWLGQHEVTQWEWRRVMQTAPWSGEDYVKAGDNYPATYVSWADAIEFCEKLSEQEHNAGRLPGAWHYTLPTEAQWEYACRAGTTTRYSFGDAESDLPEYAWFEKNARAAGENYAHQVGQKKANGFGLHDMHGNAWEWCHDGYQPQLRGGMDPQTPSSGVHVCRGGSWCTPATGCRSAMRSTFAPDYRSYRLGFRVALDKKSVK
jgi:formylglycine-generating enzyme required for sulfatase activity